MLFQHTDEELMIRETAERLAVDRLAPHADRLDRGEGREQMLANLRTLAEQGFMGLNIAAEHGGSEAGAVAFALSIEAFGAACAATTVTVSVTNMVAEVIQSVGSDEQKRAYLPPLCDGTFPAGAFCLTESGAGSDPAGMALSARMDGNEWVLNGSKIYISSAEYAGLFVVWAVTDPDAPKGKGISCFLVEAGTPGMTIGKPERKMGQTGSATSSVTFEDCRIPADALLGAENDGYRIAVTELTGGRIGVSGLALGIARAAMDAAEAYVSERRQFDRRIADMQGIQWMIADRETELEAARLLMLKAAHLKDQGADFRKAASMAKLYSSEAAQRATYTAIQLFGGAGYLADYHVERLARDARITTIYEGTSEIQRMIIAREVLKDFAGQA
ncbi:MAG TPA: acyl-CoA dehydrogenase family protein [Afifellaceae bacterium]|nr:acyl-CoA dehydrogenase family protein [Afifellaceae bacterium]